MLLLENIHYLDWKSFKITEGNLLVEEGKNKAVRFVNQSEIEHLPANCKRLNTQGKIVTRAFVNAHHHAYSALATGMPQPAEAPQNFLEILQKIWWKLDKALRKDMVEISAAVTAINSAKNGVGFVIDHHASPNAVLGSLDAMAQQFENVGINHLLCYEISDRDGEKIRNEGLDETANYLEKHQGLVGLHAAFTLSDESLKEAFKLAEKYQSGVHIHVAEDAYDQSYNLEKYNKRVVERLNHFGLLNFDKTILAHCIHINQTERELIANSKAWVVQNPESNLNNQVGFFNGHGLEAKSMLGTDGMHSNMIRSAQWAYFAGLGKDTINIPRAYERLRNTHNYLSLNSFKGDGENNLVIFDYDAPTPLHQDNFLGHFFFAFENRQIDSLIVDGKMVMHNKKVNTVDEDSIRQEAKKLSRILWKSL